MKGIHNQKLKGLACFLLLLSIVVLSACQDQPLSEDRGTGDSSSALPIRLFDNPSFLEKVKDLNTRTEFVENLKIPINNWVMIGEDNQQASSYYRAPTPPDCVSFMQELRNKEPAKLLLGDREIPFVKNIQILRREGVGWTFDQPDFFRSELVVPKEKPLVRSIVFRFDTELLTVDFRLMRLGSLVEVRVDDRLVGSFKKESNDLMRFQKYINAGTGRHRLEIRLVQNEPGAARVTAIGIGDSSAILLKTANSDNLARNGNLQFSYNRVDPPNKRLIETIRDDLNQHFETENYPLDSIVFKTRLNGLDSSIQETRRSVNLFPGSSISYQTQLTENPLILEFSYGYFEWGQSPENSFIVKISSEGDNPINRAHGYQLRDLRKGAWRTQRLDLAEFSGRQVDISFEYPRTASLEKRPGHLLLGEPILFTERPDTSPNVNVILVSMDTMRGDRTEASGFERKVTPGFDRLANGGVSFSQAFSQTGWTLPSHKSMLTGIYPFAAQYLSSRFVGLYALPESIPTLASYLRASNYRTYAHTNGGYVAAHYGFHKDFDTFVEYRDMKGTKIDYLGQQRIIKENGWESALEWLNDNHKAGPFFLFLHTYGPHTPYSSFGYEHYFQEFDRPSNLPPDIETAIPGELSEDDQVHLQLVYDRNLKRSTDELGSLVNLLDRLGVLENTLLIVTSDHGELLGEHQVNADHGTVWKDVLQIPLVFHFPGKVPAGKVVNQRVQLVDLFPTVLDFIGLKTPDYAQGKSLLPFLKGENPKNWNEAVFASHYHPLSTVMDGDYKYIADSNPEEEFLFHIGSDPHETENLLNGPNEHEGFKRDLARKLAYYIAEQVPGWNVLVNPPEGSSIRVNLDFYQFEDSDAAATKRQFSLGPFKTFINYTEVETDGFPVLMMLEQPVEKQFGVRLEILDPETKEWKDFRLPVSIGFSAQGTQTPVRIDPSAPSSKAPLIQEGIESGLFEKFPVLVWRSNLPFSLKHGMQEVSLTDQDLQALRDLGYIE